MSRNVFFDSCKKKGGHFFAFYTHLKNESITAPLPELKVRHKRPFLPRNVLNLLCDG